MILGIYNLQDMWKVISSSHSFKINEHNYVISLVILHNIDYILHQWK